MMDHGQLQATPENAITKSSSDNGSLRRSAKSIMTNVIGRQLCSIPGYHILESYKDRICKGLPVDYNGTLVRLQSLIRVSDHMIQWALTGDMSKVNHRIYEIALVRECFQPHFIKFCDIMEELSTDSLAVVELRKTLIEQLQPNTADHEEASSKEQCKKSSYNNATTIPIAVNAIKPQDSLCSDITPTTDSPAVSSLQTARDNHNSAITLTAATTIQSDTTDHSSLSIPLKCSSPLSHDHEPESACTVVVASPTTVSSHNEIHLETSDHNDVAVSSVVTASITSDKTQFTEASDAMTVSTTTDENLQSTCNVDVSIHDATKEAALVTSGCDKEQTELSTTTATPKLAVTDVTSKAKSVKQSSVATLTSDDATTAKVKSVASRESIATLSLDTTQSSGTDDSVTALLKRDGPVTSDQLEINQFIDFLIDNKILNFVNLVNLCLMSQQQRNLVLRDLVHLQGVVKDPGTEVHSKLSQDVSASAPVRCDIDQTLLAEVHEVLKAKEFAIVKSKYAEIFTCFPENYEATVGCLQSCLSDSDICEILSMNSGQNQKILNCLILKLKSKEDLLDFCDSLEKVNGFSPTLKLITRQIKKEAIEMLHSTSSPVESSRDSATSKTASTKVMSRLPLPVIPIHPSLLVTPKVTDPFETCSLSVDSKGLAALKKHYLVIVESLPHNHLISLVRLQNVAVIPEEIVDSIVPSPSAEIGNKLIVNYLIGLMHTEEHIITFCKFMKKMIREFDKYIFVLNLQNLAMDYEVQEISTPKVVDSSSSVADLPSATTDSAVLTKPVANKRPFLLSSDKEVMVRPNIATLLKLNKQLSFHKPRLSEDEVMEGYLQCMLIMTNGGKAMPMKASIPEKLTLSSTNEDVHDLDSINESGQAAYRINDDINVIKSYIKHDRLKEYAFSLCDYPSAQQSKQFYLDSIEILFKECTKAGVWIYYTGCAEEGTGNWCFKDGTISFQEIFTLYKTYLKRKFLYLVIDCNYSGQWVVECAKCLDEMGIAACGHQALDRGILLKVFASCQPNQRATTHHYVTKKGINLENFSMGCHCDKLISISQTTYGCDFTHVRCLQMRGPKALCRLPNIPTGCWWKWADIVSTEQDNRPASYINVIRNTENGRRRWHYVCIKKELYKLFNQLVATGSVSVAGFGFVVENGWGEDPPRDIAMKMKKYSPKYW